MDEFKKFYYKDKVYYSKTQDLCMIYTKLKTKSIVLLIADQFFDGVYNLYNDPGSI